MLPWLVGLGVVALYLWQKGKTPLPLAPIAQRAAGSAVPVMAPPPVNLSSSWRNPMIAPSGGSAPGAPAVNYGPILNAFGQVVSYGWGQVQADGSIDPSTAQAAGSAFDAAANTVNLGQGAPAQSVDTGGADVGRAPRYIVTVHTARGWVRRVSV